MYWTCKKCETKNPENAKKCGKCGAVTEVKKKIQPASIVTATVVFSLMYFLGTAIGGTMVAFSVEPTDEEILSAAKAAGSEEENLMKIGAEEKEAAREAAIVKARAELSPLVKAILFWFFPLLLFPIIGAVVGFVSPGRTIIEAAIGSSVAQVLGFLGQNYGFQAGISFIELGLCMVIGFFIVAAGAFVGEAIQEKKERAVLEMTELEEASYQ